MSEHLEEGKEEEFFSTFDDFKEAVNIARDLIGKRGITIKISSSLRFILTVDESLLDDRLKSASISSETFAGIIKSEIGDMISAVVLEKQDSYIGFVLEDIHDEVEKKERESLIKQKIKLVEETIADETIRKKYLVKVTSKVDSFEDISWEINEKKYDVEHELDSLFYATIKLDFKRNPLFRYRSPVGLILGSGEEDFSAIFDCDASQIDDIIGVLEDIRGKLREQEGKR